MGAGGSVESTSSPRKSGKIYPTYSVTLNAWYGCPVLDKLNVPFKLRLSYESVDFIDNISEELIIQFPFQNILCWGSSATHFQFKIINFQKIRMKVTPVDDDKSTQKSNKVGETWTMISLRTTSAREIENKIMATVQSLMKDMSQRAISGQEFECLMDEVFTKNETGEDALVESYIGKIEQFSAGGRLLLAKQAMDLLIKVGKVDPFEKFSLACFLYDKIINKDSYQLIVNTFEDENERENLIHALKLNRKDLRSAENELQLSSKSMVVTQK